MRCVNVDPNEILENRFTSEDAKFYLRNLGPALLLTVPVLAMIVLMALMGKKNVLLMGGMFLLLVVGCAYKLVSVRINGNKKLKASVDKFGRDNLAMDLRDPSNEVYMLHPDKLETYIIVSSRYLYFSKLSVFALDDIKKAYININDMTNQNRAGGNVRPYDHSNKNVSETVRFCKPAYITTMDGHTERLLVALEENQMRQLSEFFATLGQ